MSKVVILSIDGGGIRGVLPGKIVAEIENRIKQRTSNKDSHITKYVDFFAGTSTGSILSVGYNIFDPIKPNIPKYSATDISNFYLEYGTQIFKRGLSHKIKSLGGLISGKYDSTILKSILENVYGNQKLSQSIKPLLIPSQLLNINELDISESGEYFFKTTKAKKRDRYDFKLSDVVLASSSAPQYFDAAVIENFNFQIHSFIDGGLYMINPSLSSFIEVQSMNFTDKKIKFPKVEDIIIISIGSGDVTQSIPSNKSQMGLIQTAYNLGNLVIDSSRGKVHHMLNQIYKQNKSQYIRLEPKIFEADSRIDCSSKENIKKLYSDAQRNIELLDKEINQVVQTLISSV